MSEDIPKKRTRSQMKGKRVGQEDSIDELLSRKYLIQTEEGRQAHNVVPDEREKRKERKKKELKEKLSKLQESDNENNQETREHENKEKQNEPKHRKKSKNKHKHRDRDQQKIQGQVKEEEQEKQSAKQQKKTQKQHQNQLLPTPDKKKKNNHSEKKIPDVKQPEKKEKKSKHQKEHKIPKGQTPEKQVIKKQKHHEEQKVEEQRSQKNKKSTIKQKESISQKEQQQQLEASDSDSEASGEASKKIKKTRGRKKKQFPIKRKRMSIYERQQIINRKWRVKKKSSFINKMSNRAWGQLRTGPYRRDIKIAKADQRIMIDKIVGEGPQSQQQQSADENEIKVEEQKSRLDDEEKLEQEEVIQPRKDKKKKKKRNSSEQKQEPSRSKSKKNYKKTSGKADDQLTATAPSSTKSKKKKTKEVFQQSDEVKTETVTVKPKKKKKKAKKQSSSSEDDQIQAKIEEGATEETRSKKKKVKRQQSDDQDSDQQSRSKGKKSKKEVKRQASSKRSKPKAVRQQQTDFTKEQSEKIIDLFAMDGGNYPEMMKELPGIRLKKVRLFLRKLFLRALDIITYQVQHLCNRKIKEWQQDEKIQIVRELHRIRSSNRLLSQNNVQFRDKMTALMHSYNDQGHLNTVSERDIEDLYSRLEQFVRGYNTINRTKRTGATSITDSKNKQKQQRYKFTKDVTRKPIISGGHLLSRTVKKENKEEQDEEDPEKMRPSVTPDSILKQWSREEECELCQLYLINTEADEVLCDKLKQKFGPKLRWRDFDVLDNKLNQCIKMSLIKLQNLTARPYNQHQKQMSMQRKRNRIFQQIKREHSNGDQMIEHYYTKLKESSMFMYDNDIFKKEERLEYKHRIFKNLPLLERQIFGHLESYKLKNSLIKILIEEFPTQEEIEGAVIQAKKFSKWARQNQKRGNVSSIKSILIGQRTDFDEDDEDDSNEDSIMADISKIPITKTQESVHDSMQAPSQEPFSNFDDKSQLFGDGSRRGGSELPIEVDENEQEVMISDFQQPEEAIELQDSPENQQDYNNLQRLYAKLNTSNVQQ